MARAASECEDLIVLEENEHPKYNHQEDSLAFQEKLRKHLDNHSKEMDQLGNPVIVDDSKELIQLGTKGVMGSDAVSTIRQIEELGKS